MGVKSVLILVLVLWVFFFFFVLSLQQWESGISIQIGCVKTQLFGFKWLSIIHGQNMESHLNSQDYKGHIVLL